METGLWTDRPICAIVSFESEASSECSVSLQIYTNGYHFEEVDYLNDEIQARGVGKLLLCSR
jgi:hypothetical protein